MNIENSRIYFFLRNSVLYGMLQPIWRFYYRRCRKRAMKLYACELLENMKQILDKNNILFWLDFGTLLGAYRDKDFISYDCDIDIAILYEDAERVRNLLKNSDFCLTHEYRVGKAGEVAQLSYKYKSLSIDICFYHKKNESMYCYLCSILPGVSIVNNRRCVVAVAKCVVPCEKFAVINFHKLIYHAPFPTEEYLAAHYGPNFMIPDSKFDYTKDAPNITNYAIEELAGECIYND